MAPFLNVVDAAFAADGSLWLSFNLHHLLPLLLGLLILFLLLRGMWKKGCLLKVLLIISPFVVIVAACAAYILQLPEGSQFQWSLPPDDVELSTMQLHEQLPEECNGRQRHLVYSWLDKTLASTDGFQWGQMLDAGSGVTSLCWLMRQAYQSITAVTAESGKQMYGSKTLKKISVGRSVNVLVGNWQDKELLAGSTFDVVLADYLLGAVDRYWAYAEDEMMARVLNSVRPGGFLVFVGLEPYELVLDPKDPKDKFVLEVEALGDAACNLASHRSYRELPQEWVVRQILRSAEFRLVAKQEFPMTLRKTFMDSQLDFATWEAKQIDDAGIKQALMARVKQLKSEARSFGVHKRGENYAIVAQRFAIN